MYFYLATNHTQIVVQHITNIKKMRKITITIILFIISSVGISQTKNFIDQPYLETTSKVDTLITPDRIHLSILITEKDTKGKISVEELENKMANVLSSIGINLEKQLTLSDLSSNFKKYFLKQKDVLKTKSYSLLVYDALTAGKVIIAMERINISNVSINETEYSKIEELKLYLKSKAVEKAKLNAKSMVAPLNQKVGKAIFISDLTNISNMLQGRAAGIVIRGAASIKNYEYKPIDISFQKIKVESEVTVKFIIE
jgi:uncharacterized protein